jgi:hypothetical protein
VAVSERAAKTTGGWTRARLGVQVALALALAAAAAGAITWLSERPGLRKRIDLTASGRNTLDPRLSELLAALPERVFVDVFFRPVVKPLTEVGAEAQTRMHELLTVAQNQEPEKIKVVAHDLNDIAGVREALRGLGVEGDEFGLVVVHRGTQKAVLRLFTDIAHIDLGRPAQQGPYIPPRLASFRGEEALASALKRVSLGAPPKVLFATGHGERALDGDGELDLGRLSRALVADGFELGTWDARQSAEVPEDCAVLALVAPRQPLLERERVALESYLRRGGRLLAAPGDETLAAGSNFVALLAGAGVAVGSGFVAAGVPTSTGVPQVGLDACANLFVRDEGLDPRHAITETLRRYHRTVWFVRSRPLERTNRSPEVVAVELARSPADSWIDLPDAEGRHDWTPDRSIETVGRASALAIAVSMPAPDAPPPAPSEAPRDARVVALGTPEVLVNATFETNADFALNAFNWLAARDWRVSIATRADEPRILEVRTGSNLASVQRIAVVLLPAVCATLGLVLAWRRRR